MQQLALGEHAVAVCVALYEHPSKLISVVPPALNEHSDYRVKYSINVHHNLCSGGEDQDKCNLYYSVEGR